LRYWRIYACLLALGIGALAVCADEAIRGGALPGKENRRAKVDPKIEPPLAPADVSPPPPISTAPDTSAKTVVVPMVPLAQAVVPASFEPPLDGGDAKPVAPVALYSFPNLSPAKPAGVDLPMPDSPKADPLPAPPSNKLDSSPAALPPPPPPVPMVPKFDPLPTPAVAPMPMTPPVANPMLPPPPPVVPAKAESTNKPAGAKPIATPGQYKVLLRMGGTGQPRFEVRDGEQLLLKVTCEQIELHGAQDGTAALPGLTATGKVKLHGSGLDGTCDQLTIVSAKGEVAMKGNVHLTCYRGNTSSQVVAESVMFQLNRNGESISKGVKSLSTGVVPASATMPR
jgi:hypothetical protein